LGRKTGGVGDLFPHIRRYFKEKSSIPRNPGACSGDYLWIFGKLKENRRLTVRYEKSDINFLGFILVAFLKILLC
jgi:hypothetical protein